MNQRFPSIITSCMLGLCAGYASADTLTLRVHHFMPASTTLQVDFLEPLAERLATASDGRLQLELFASMSLGGRPGDLYDQAVDGAVDMALTLPGYTPGRFNRSEVFELPFMMSDPVATAEAFWTFIDTELQDDEYEEAHILAGWVHGPGVLHSQSPIRSLEDLQGLEVRGPTRVVTDLLGELGATPVGMPLPQIPESLSRGVIDATALPWEVTPSIKLAELVDYHTEFAGSRALYTATFVLAMNHDTYDDMPDDLRAILDTESGLAMSAFAARVQSAADASGREAAADNTLIILPEEESARWIDAAQPVYQRWIDRAAERGFDGAATIAQAQQLIDTRLQEQE